MLYLNDNPGASFVYGNKKVPVKCGTKVTFNGGHTHNTEVLAGGTVKFLGPITVASGLRSGSYDGQCETVLFGPGSCSCRACDASLPPSPGVLLDISSKCMCSCTSYVGICTVPVGSTCKYTTPVFVPSFASRRCRGFATRRFGRELVSRP